MKRGVLIAFEGIEGSGKTTQAKMMYEYLKSKNIPAVFTREPGGTPCGEKIREILLDPAFKGMHPKTELLLYLASRSEHVAKLIRRSLFVDKAVVITDRYELSSLAYQGAGRGLTLKVVSRLNKFATGGLSPDLTIIVDIDVNKALARLDKNKDRIEQEGKKFHALVRATYLSLARRAPKRIKVFNGEKDKDELHEEIKRTIMDFLKRKGVYEE